jgi:hypothetical protein
MWVSEESLIQRLHSNGTWQHRSRATAMRSSTLQFAIATAMECNRTPTSRFVCSSSQRTRATAMHSSPVRSATSTAEVCRSTFACLLSSTESRLRSTLRAPRSSRASTSEDLPTCETLTLPYTMVVTMGSGGATICNHSIPRPE